jgi:hypothetical protein
MASPTRRALLCAQNPRVVTGIDFVQVVDPTTQTELQVFFVIDPDQLVPPLATGPYPATVNGLTVTITAVYGGAAVPISTLRWAKVTLDPLGAATRVCLDIVVAEPGGFEPYRLTITHSPGPGKPNQIDTFSGTVVFDFKQGCPTGADCEATQDCPVDPGVDFPVDYLARDFSSLSRALLDFAAQRYPDWKEPIPADIGGMLLEIMAALGDEFAWTQDRFDAETRFGSATQRASLHALARLVDYEPGRGQPAHGEVDLEAIAGGTLAADAVFWAAGPAESLVPFSLDAAIWVHPFWNSLKRHNPNPSITCLPAGQTSVLVVAGDPGPGGTPPDPANPGNPMSVATFLTGRRMMLLSDPTDAAEGRKAWPVTITGVDVLSDPLILTGGGQPTPVLRLSWADAEATPFDLPVDGLTAALNVGLVTAGQPVTAYARAGADPDIATAWAGQSDELRYRLLGLDRLIEREGPYVGDTGNLRSVVARLGLLATESGSLRFNGAGEPRLTITQLKAPAGFPTPLPADLAGLMALFVADPAEDWSYVDDLLSNRGSGTIFTVEPGMWRRIETHHLPTGDLGFAGYAVDSGWTVVFGFGGFGEAPADGALLRLDYHTDPGLAGNIASETLGLSWPKGPAPDPLFAGLIDKATNPLAFSNATGEESASSIRLGAPNEYRAQPLRAVRPEDYSNIIERLPWVQRANATTRWTGSWPTDFVAVDPHESIAITDAQRVALAAEIDCIRLVTRDARVADPDYVDIDIEVDVCIAAGFYTGDVLKRLRAALAARGFFDPDHFTFGSPLVRSALEAAAQDVAGVAHVDAIRIHVHGQGPWRDFTEDQLAAAPDQIIRLVDDPDRSTLGLLTVAATGTM